MTTGTEDAMALIRTQSAINHAEDGAGLDSIVPSAIDSAAEILGTQTVQYIGQSKQYRPQGGGNDYAARLAGVHPQSRGAGILTPIPGHGAVDAKGSAIKTGRVAQGDHDYTEVFFAARDGSVMWSFSSANAVTVDGLILTVPVANGTTAALHGTAYLDTRPVNSSSGVAVTLALGDEGISGDASMSQADASDSRAITVGYADQWFQPYLSHTRLIVGTEATESAGVSCFVTVKQIGGGSTGGTVWRFKAGDTFKVTADGVNLRSGHSTDASVIVTLNTGTNGVVNSGPYSGSGYRWWNVTAGGYAGYLAENFMKRTTVDVPVASTSSVRSGWIRITREVL
jgi:uncharacterized protein YgiM (DUF1202 family)